MAKKATRKLTSGTAVRVKDGVCMPEFPDVDVSGWTGVAVEVRGRGATMKCFIEWDDATLERMPEPYRKQCEESGLYYGMACIPAADVGFADEA
ncbi:hypothetical protein Mal4_34650 [Maioricimonas rarisocia]|uniref:Uncharacterized protein n=1 Tax=Maioricimonas rarisocia TaxID=2528026 RepID=A0A517Z9N1_9PLAN|nr:hypothetical protein [Maioricimonas rarisocia]QDU39130.1 hypothetical protein Mal4_34650 [Maioricimonas rarisocia]